MLTWVEKANEYGCNLSKDELVEFATEAYKFMTAKEEYQVPEILQEHIHHGCVCGSPKCYIKGIVCRAITKYDGVAFAKARNIITHPVVIEIKEIYKQFEMDYTTYTKDVGCVVSVYMETHSCYDPDCKINYCNGKGKECVYCRKSCTDEYCDCCFGIKDSDSDSEDSDSNDDDDEFAGIPEWKKKYITGYRVVTGKCFANKHMSGDEFDVGPDHA